MSSSSSNNNELVQIEHSSSGAKLSIHPFGGTITSYTNSSGRETLFVSRDAKLDGSKAIRGGIPICFPQFGQPDKSYPQHGFLRNNYWKVVEGSKYDRSKNDGEGGAAGLALEISLSDAVNSRGGKWAIGTTELNVTCRMDISITANTMTNTMTMTNTGSKPFDFQVLLHTYYAVDNGNGLNGDVCNVKGLEGYSVMDKVTAQDEYVMGSEPIVIGDGLFDRVYSPPPSKVDLDVTLMAGSPDAIISLKANGSVDGTAVPVSGVVWNPHKEKAEQMGDFGSDQYVDMICVEPGLLKDVPLLEPGKSAKFCQIITT